MTEAEFTALVSVSRETRDRLAAYVAVLVKWNAKINLVGPATLSDVWRRHILDSAQIHLAVANTGVLVDLGSGAGLPGLILAIMGGPQVHLVESDARKCAFLHEAARVTGTAVTIHNKRIDAVPSLQADIVTARALAPLAQLLDHAIRFLKPAGKCVFLKGARQADELTEARKCWHMRVTERPSLSDPSGVILEVESPVRER
ncbi:MAG TPA: 16S rRNA (guanine(527)-N(7))-methyltransferase RsmG [Aliidongia sp.]|uniref:16S rRNA (guanine(527)-N(7))-methyltransferase RsmG n=1 Tax=Aliidongia sp. TaxID=1914230 RepID=UPI002DDD980C|nr:16S rRNA (guanine(527)-N(7))-methyltransferase RsmG [Aliidongia sp.]HEV2676874.1 16S rRNA (guanine(527)-N(7))-methyltransferase RsmG [Aliidongia sp.]